MQVTSIHQTYSISHQINDFSIFTDMRSRPESELTQVANFLSQYSLFQNMALDSRSFKSCLRNLLYYLDYQTYPANTPLYHEGSTTNTIYFVLQGKVSTYVPKPLQELKSEMSNEENDAKGSISSSRSQKRVGLDSMNMNALLKLQGEINLKNNSGVNFSRQKTGNRTRGNSVEDDMNVTKRFRKVSQVNEVSRKGTLVQDQRLEATSPKEGRDGSSSKKSTKLFVTSLHNMLNIKEGDKFYDSIEELDTFQNNERQRTLFNSNTLDKTIKLFRSFTNRIYKYFLRDHFLYKLSNEIESGACLGHCEFSESTRPLPHTAICTSETHMLICQHKDFVECFQDIIFEKAYKLASFKKYFANIAKASEINAFCDRFQKLTYGMNEAIFSEGIEPDGLYFIFKGEVELHKFTADFRDFSPTRSKSYSRLGDSSVHKKGLLFPILKLGSSQFFGEEILNEEPGRKFTAITIASHNEVYFLPTDSLSFIKETCKNILDHLRNQYSRKLRARDQRLRNLSSVNITTEIKEEGEQNLPQSESLRKLEKYFRPTVDISPLVKELNSEGLLTLELAKGRETRNRVENAKKTRPPDYLKLMRVQKEISNTMKEKRASSWDKESFIGNESFREAQTHRVNNMKTVRLVQPNRTKHRQISGVTEVLEISSTKGDTETKFYENLQSKDSFSKGNNSDFLNEEFNPKAIKAVFGSTQSSTEEDDKNFKRAFITDNFQKEERAPVIRGRNLNSREKEPENTQGIRKVRSVLKVRENFLPNLNRQGYMRNNSVMEVQNGEDLENLERHLSKTERNETKAIKEVLKPDINTRNLLYYKQRVELIKSWALFNEISANAVKNGKPLKIIKTERSPKNKKVKIKEDKSNERLKPGLMNVKRMFARLNKRQRESGTVTNNDTKMNVNGSNVDKNKDSTYSGDDVTIKIRENNISESLTTSNLIKLDSAM